MASLFKDLKFTEGSPIYLQLVNYCKIRIASGKLADGDELPSRRALAALLGINPMTVQKAYKIMEEEGFLATSPNSGSKINLNGELRNKIRNELCGEQVSVFIRAMQDIGMDFKSVIDFVSEAWDVEAGGKK